MNQPSGGGRAAAEIEATLGCVVQLLAMVNTMRDNLLVFAAEPSDWPLARVDVSGVLEQALKDVQPLMRSSKVKLQTDVASGLQGLADKSRCAPRKSHAFCGAPQGSPRCATRVRVLRWGWWVYRLHQAMVTMLYVAARHAMRKPLHVSLQSDGGMLVFRTRDEGRGFGDDVIERFSKAATDMDTEHPESTLSVGLTGVKRICERLYWQLQISNEAPGSTRKGGTVMLRIPSG